MRRIFLWVVSIHILLVLWMGLWREQKPKGKKILTERIVHVRPSSSQKVKESACLVAAPASTRQTPTRQAEVKKEPLPKPKKEVPAVQKLQKPKASAIKVPPVKKQEKKTSPSSSIPQTLLKQLQESIAKIEQKEVNKVPAKEEIVPKWTAALEIENQEIEGDFVSQLVSCMQNALDLPEVGEVRLELNLNREGRVLFLRILRAESARNSAFLEKKIKELTFPPFTGNLKNEKEHIFIITFCNKPSV